MLIEGRLEEISAGTVTNGQSNSVEYIKVDGKRHQNLIYDNYIGTALKNALDDGEPVSLSLTGSCVAAVKRSNGEVSRTKQSVGLYLFVSMFQIGILCGVGGLILSGIIGIVVGSLAVFQFTYFLIIAIGGGLLVKTSIAYKKSRDAFGIDT